MFNFLRLLLASLFFLSISGVNCSEPVVFSSEFELLQKDAMKGNLDAQSLLGYSYEVGRGTERDLQKAFEWYKRAAERNHPCAQYSLGFCYEMGIGVEKNLEKAYFWYEKSSDQGYVDARD